MVSPYIFIFAVNFFVIWINYTKQIEGTTYAKKESRSETFVERIPEYLRKCVEIVRPYAKIIGLECNLEKTSVMPKDGNFDIEDKLCADRTVNGDGEWD